MTNTKLDIFFKFRIKNKILQIIIFFESVRMDCNLKGYSWNDIFRGG